MTDEELRDICADMARHCFEQQLGPILNKQADLLLAVSQSGGGQVMLAAMIANHVIGNAFATASVHAKSAYEKEAAEEVKRLLVGGIETCLELTFENANAG